MVPEATIVGDKDGAWSFTDRYLDVNGLRLHYVEATRAGGDADRTLLALHGMGSYGGAWRAVLSNLPSVDRAILPDFRGHGVSDWTTQGYWLADYAADITQLIEQLELTDIDLAGHSLGARVSMVLAPQVIGALRTVTLSDTGPEVSREGALKAKSIAATGSTSKHFRDQAAVAAALRAEHPDWAQEAVDLRAELLYRENWAGRWVPRGDPEVEHLLGRAGLKEVDDMWAGLAATTVPTLLIRGMKSFLLDDELAKRMCDALPQPTLAELDLTHDMLYVRPDLVADTIDGFLRAH